MPSFNFFPPCNHYLKKFELITQSTNLPVLLIKNIFEIVLSGTTRSNDDFGPHRVLAQCKTLQLYEDNAININHC